MRIKKGNEKMEEKNSSNTCYKLHIHKNTYVDTYAHAYKHIWREKSIESKEKINNLN